MMIKEILVEYALVIPCFLFIWFLMPRALVYIEKKDKSEEFERLFRAIMYWILYIAIVSILLLLFFVGNPIRILIRFRQEFKAILPTTQRYTAYFVTVLPIPLSLLVIFEFNIKYLMYEKKYYSGKNAYVVQPSQYKTPQQFIQELEDRGLYYQKEHKKQLKGLNLKFGRSLEGDSADYYTSGTMMSFRFFEDSYTRHRFIKPDSKNSEPAYIYNGILILDEQDVKLKYAPIGRYMMNGCGKIGNENKPYYKDYYIECKILMIDGHVYAIIGTGESRHVEQSFPENERPFYVLLSEEDQVTTFYRKKFYPDGSIEVRYAEVRRLSMIPNTKENKSDGYWTSRFPVRKVERIDKNTIDAVALELANGVLKESIESFKSGNL